MNVYDINFPNGYLPAIKVAAYNQQNAERLAADWVFDVHGWDRDRTRFLDVDVVSCNSRPTDLELESCEMRQPAHDACRPGWTRNGKPPGAKFVKHPVTVEQPPSPKTLDKLQQELAQMKARAEAAEASNDWEVLRKRLDRAEDERDEARAERDELREELVKSEGVVDEALKRADLLEGKLELLEGKLEQMEPASQDAWDEIRELLGVRTDERNEARKERDEAREQLTSVQADRDRALSGVESALGPKGFLRWLGRAK